MKITAQWSFWLSLAFAAGCTVYALVGFSSIDASLTDAQRADARGFAWFWLFLGGVGVAVAIVSGLMARGRFGALDE